MFKHQLFLKFQSLTWRHIENTLTSRYTIWGWGWGCIMWEQQGKVPSWKTPLNAVMYTYILLFGTQSPRKIFSSSIWKGPLKSNQTKNNNSHFSSWMTLLNLIHGPWCRSFSNSHQNNQLLVKLKLFDSFFVFVFSVLRCVFKLLVFVCYLAAIDGCFSLAYLLSERHHGKCCCHTPFKLHVNNLGKQTARRRQTWK